MELSTKCQKCGKEAWVVFDVDLGEKTVRCRFCGNIGSADELPFNSNPEFLYKYRPHNSNSESWILNEELYFASPGSFNDPFDSKVMYTMDGTTEQKKRYMNKLLEVERPQLKKRERWKYINKALEDQILEKDYDNHVKRMQKRIDEYGVVSLSQKPDDLLMFSYYAKDHTGYCLKYKRSTENILSLARKVNYEPLYPKFSVYDFTLDNVGGLGDKVLLTKAKCWEHEAEWRISLANPAGRVIKSHHEILVGIILGCNMSDEHRAQIVALNKRREKPVGIFLAQKRKFEFGLEITTL